MADITETYNIYSKLIGDNRQIIEKNSNPLDYKKLLKLSALYNVITFGPNNESLFKLRTPRQLAKYKAWTSRNHLAQDKNKAMLQYNDLVIDLMNKHKHLFKNTKLTKFTRMA